jgi:hypothetical protein
MSWSFLPACTDLAQEYLKVLSLGACIGSGLRPGWPTLNAFSAQAMALPPIVGSHDIRVLPEEAGVTASAWGGGGRLLLAAHNDSPEARSVTIDLSAQAVSRSGASPGSTALSRILSRNADDPQPGPVASRPDHGSIRLTVRLGPGEALLWGNWGWE